ncbi:MAG: hypothetical protein KGJ06_09065, partial [Pseudomonadota bacterium]|nr:hypothetical protein [Pseudomonadota bacterium]
MLLSFKKESEGETGRKPAAKGRKATPPSEFIPYYCHFNPHTLLTKNGELMQIIRITSNGLGLDYESGESTGEHDATMRGVIRAAIGESIQSDRFALWIHTARKRRNIRFDAKFRDPFAAYAHKRWRQKARWQHQYYNEIYITVLYEGQTAALVEKQDWAEVSIPARNRHYRNAYLDIAYEELNATVAMLMEKIRPHYQPHLLTVEERLDTSLGETLCYSQPMEFLGTLVNLRAESMPMGNSNISTALPTTALTFGFNALETRGGDNVRRYGAIMSLKQYREIPADTADRILQAPMEFVISQAFRFIPQKKALKPYREQKELFTISGDMECIEASGIEDMIQSNRQQPTDFGEQQIGIMVMADDYKHLDDEVASVQSAFAELGLVTIREDIRLEDCFWSLLPGNFEFLRRLEPINTARIAGFCRLNRYSGGTPSGNRWGNAVTLAPTTVNSPYFFNFHYQDNGHTLLFDANSFNDAAGRILLNFLLTETRQYDGRLCIFDRHQSARLLLDRLGGDYHTFAGAGKRQPLGINPFTLENNPRNQSFLLAWCSSLLNSTLTDEQKEYLRAAIEQLYAGPADQRHLPGLLAQVAAMNPVLAATFAPWHGDGALAGMIDSAEDRIDFSRLLHGFDMTPILERQECTLPVFSYLLHRLITS